MKGPDIQPGGIFLPHFVWKELMPELKDSELRVLIVVVGHTIAFKEKNGARRLRHWLSHAFLKKQTGRSGQSVSDALDALVQRGVIGVWSSTGTMLSTKKARQSHRGKLLLGFNEELAHAVLEKNPWLQTPNFLRLHANEARLQKLETIETASRENNKLNKEKLTRSSGWVSAAAIADSRRKL